MKYHEMNVGEKSLKLRIRMRDHAELDKLAGGDFLGVLTNETQVVAKAWKILGDVIYIGARADVENGAMKRDMVDEMIDGMIDDGYDVNDAVDDILKIAAVSGFFPRAAAEAILAGKLEQMQGPAEQGEQESA